MRSGENKGENIKVTSHNEEERGQTDCHLVNRWARTKQFVVAAFIAVQIQLKLQVEGFVISVLIRTPLRNPKR